MMLRSSSTPLLGSLLSSKSESPNNHHQTELHTTTKHAPSPVQNCSKLSCNNGGGSQSYTKSMRGSSSPSVAEMKTQSGLRRVQSEGNMEDLAMDSYNLDEFAFPKKFARKPNLSSLEPIPSFTHHKLGTAFEDSEDEEGSQYELDGEQCEGYGNSIRAESMVLERMTKKLNDHKSWGFESERMMYLASGPGILGISLVDNGVNGGGSGGGSSRPVAFDQSGGGGGGGGDNKGVGMEGHYKKELAENPGNPLFLRNYAQFLYQTKGDLPGAEEYYSRAILADPEDGEVLSQYATLIWDLHQDKERATSYFERAVRVSSEDSHIHAAYASFLWDAEDEEEDTNNSHFGQPFIHHGNMASATT